MIAGEDAAVPMRRVESGEVFWLAMVDVDHFKQINDKYGHQIGDEVLILAGAVSRGHAELSLPAGGAHYRQCRAE